jgi:hypothetical protein
MTFEVTVALAGDPNSPPPGGLEQNAREKPWSERTTTILEIAEGETLLDVIERAGEDLGSRPFMSILPRQMRLAGSPLTMQERQLRSTSEGCPISRERPYSGLRTSLS